MSAAAILSLLSTIILDGSVALAIMLAATGLGAIVVGLLRLGPLPGRWRILLAAGLGVGALSLLVLALGSCGLLSRPPWIIFVAVFALLGIGQFMAASEKSQNSRSTCGPRALSEQFTERSAARWGQFWAAYAVAVVADDIARWFRRVGFRQDPSGPAGAPGCALAAAVDVEDEPGDSRLYRLLWLIAAPFFVLAICAATCPPGYLWPSEGNGYDVLEYHFGAPKEWFVAGRIEYLPHNIYSNFPLIAELLYLLSFVIAGSPIAGVYVTQFANVFFAILAVAGAWLAGREFGRLPGIMAGLALATCPILTWLCGVAYVENGMLAMAMLSLACVVRAARRPGESAVRWAVVSGLLAGFACGFKYTAIPMVALPMLVAWLIAGRSRVRAGLAFAMGAAAAFSPWAIRNAVNTGNPVFPLARSVFHERSAVWSDEAAARWSEGHRPDPAARAPLARVREVGRTIFANPMFGVPLFAFCVWGAVAGLRRWRRETAAAIIFVLIVVAVWAGTTHLIDRFAVAIIAPLALLAAIAAASGRSARIAVVALAVVGAAWNLRSTIGVFRDARIFDVAAFGQTEWMTSGQWPGYAHVPALNKIQESGGKVLMLGDARAFYVSGRPGYHVVFNRNPFAEGVEAWLSSPTSAERPDAWLRKHGYTHLYVDWSEIRRLSRSRYGFWPGLAELHKSEYERTGFIPEASFESNGRTYSTLFRVGPAQTDENSALPSR